VINISNVINDLVESIDTTDPHEIAIKAAASIPEADLRDVCAALLVERVRDAFRAHKARTLNFPEPMSDTTPERPAVPGTKPARSSGRLKGHATKYLADFKARVASPNGGYKWLTECTREDIAFLVGSYRTSAASLTAEAAWYEQIGDAMRKARKAVVRDLPEHTLKTLLEQRPKSS
jgi:hypothetical protein